MIVGISGHMGAGKTTLGEDLRELLGEVAWTTSFAGYLKSIVSNCFDIDPENKESLTRVRIGFYYVTGRGLLQHLGEHLRSLDPDAWVRPVINELKYKEYTLRHGDLAWEDTLARSTKYHMIVTDVRYPNEVEALKKMEAKIIRLTRNPTPSNHPSETALDDCSIYQFDLVIQADATRESQLEQALSFLGKK